MAYALAAGGCWVVYIVLGRRTAAVLPGQQAVAIGMLFAALPALPLAAATASRLGPDGRGGYVLTGPGCAPAPPAHGAATPKPAP